MRSVICLVFLISIFQAINGNFLSNVQGWFTDNVEAELEVRGPLKNTGYWNFLTIGGIYGRMLHFLLTYTEGFGNEIQGLNYKFKADYGAEYYTELESHVAEHFPIGDTLFQSMMMIPKISDIQDKKTKKTLGDAIYILKNIASNRKAVNTIADRWHMVKQVSSIFKNPEDDGITDEQINKLRILLLEHPEVFQKLLAQPDVLHRLSGSVLQSLKGIDLIKAVESIQEMTVLLKTLYPQNYEEITQELLQITDENSVISFGKALETISNIVKTEVFQNKLRKLLDTDVLRQVHETSQQPLAKAVKQLDPKEALNQANPAMIQKNLKTQGIFVTVERTKRLLEDAKNDVLIPKLLRVVQRAEDESGSLTPESVSISLAKSEIQVDPEKVTRIMHLLQIFPPEMIWNTMNSVGIVTKMSDLEKLVEQARRASPLELDTYDTVETPESAPQASPETSAPADTAVPASDTSVPTSDTSVPTPDTPKPSSETSQPPKKIVSKL